MNRRWLVLCGSLVVGLSLAAAAIAQTSLTERFQQLRSGWGGGEAQEQEEAAPETPEDSTGERRGMLPNVDPRALFPDGFFGRSGSSHADASNRTPTSQRAASRTMPKPAASASTRTASQPRAGSAYNPNRQPIDVTPPTASAATVGPQGPAASPQAANRNLPPITPVLGDSRPSPTTAAAPTRRSPEHRTPPNFDSEALRNELSSSFAMPEEAAPKVANTNESENEPTLADDFAAGLEREAATLGRNEPGKSAEPIDAEPAPAQSINLRPGGSFTRHAKPSAGRSEVGGSADSRSVEQSFPSVGGLIGRKIESESTPSSSDPGSPDSDAAIIVSDDAAKAFRSGTLSTNAPKSRTFEATPFTPPTAVAPHEVGVLITNQAPVIGTDIRGPQQIMVGREATYELRIKNTGASSAENFVATVRIPSWAEVVATSATDGAVRQSDGTEPSSALEWHIPRLAANDTEQLSLRLIPRASRPLELGITWTHAPVDARTVVEVQEPKLRMSVSGPDEVLYAKPHVYRLTISNPGTGTAENVRIDLMPPGGGRESVSSHTLGHLPPGESKSVEVELTARDAGKLQVLAVATADGGLTSEANKELFCRKPELEVDWRGPETQYAGTPATYFFRVRNPGTASADNVAVRVEMPAGAEFVSASEGYRHNANKGEILWHVGSLGPGDDCYMELRCMVHTPGDNQLRVAAATAAGDLVDNKVAATKVVAIADLKLEVSDPAGPVLVGDEALYEICVTNRGASAAEEVNVVGLFSAGLEPEAAEGSAYSAMDGRVSFRTIRKLPAGQSVVMQIKARATQPGTHVFRAEVLCRDLEIKLAAEETTRFYDNQLMHESAATTVIGSRETLHR